MRGRHGNLPPQRSQILKDIHAQRLGMLQWHIFMVAKQALQHINPMERQGDIALSMFVVFVQKGRQVHACTVL